MVSRVVLAPCLRARSLIKLQLEVHRFPFLCDPNIHSHLARKVLGLYDFRNEVKWKVKFSEAPLTSSAIVYELGEVFTGNFSVP